MNPEILLKELDRRIKFHRNNQKDPHGISVSVMVALEEVLESFKKSLAKDEQPPQSK